MLTLLRIALLALLPFPAPFARAQAIADHAQVDPAIRERCRLHPPPDKTFEVVRVVDGDTIHVRRGGEVVKLRLLSVDTEEKFAVDTGSPTKPSTVFGEECSLWAQDFFAGLAGPGGRTRVGLFFPDGREQLDSYGRLLAHVVLPDGVDFDLMLVELGKSPYFNKYGNSTWHHADFVAAQKRARDARLGIWNPETNRPKTPGAPSAARPYARLLPWWDARARAIDAFREAAARGKALDAEDAQSLERAAASGAPQRIFGCVERTFAEQDGSLTLLFKTSDPEHALRASVPRASRAAFDALDLERRSGEFVQNYLWIAGKVARGERGFRVVCDARGAIEPAGPEVARR